MGRPLGFGHGCPAWPVGTGAASVGPGRDGEGATGLRVPRVWLGVSPGPEQLGRLLVPQVWGGNSSRSPSPARKGRALMGSLLAQVTRAGDKLGGLRKRLGGGGGGWGDFQALRVRISCSRLGLTHRDVKHAKHRGTRCSEPPRCHCHVPRAGQDRGDLAMPRGVRRALGAVPGCRTKCCPWLWVTKVRGRELPSLDVPEPGSALHVLGR